MYCSNCGRRGHTFKTCREPVISCGIILRRPSDGYVLLVMRKHSIGYTDFLRGKWREGDYAYISTLWNEMTHEERVGVRTRPHSLLWTEFWNGDTSRDRATEEAASRDKISRLDFARLDVLATDAWPSPEWGFPKGRRRYRETDLGCAVREFQEETAIPPDRLVIDADQRPREEHVVGSNGVRYVHRYFEATLAAGADVPAGGPLTHEQENEIGAIGWYAPEVARRLFRPYHRRRMELALPPVAAAGAGR